MRAPSRLTRTLPLLVAMTGALALASAHAGRLDLAWPTPDTAFLRGAPPTAFIQPTASGLPESGLFGCVRRGGTQFHEGIDIAPVARDARGEATDPIYAVLPGIVRHISARAGDSSYGRYVVLEHTGVRPAVVTLYSHLRSIEPSLEVGQPVPRGAVLGVMGRSASGYTIPRERAHLHFEMGLYLSDAFQDWFDRRGFGSPNKHGRFNGMNIQGFDALDFFERFRSREVDDILGYLATQEPVVRVRVATPHTPDFVTRYPDLVLGPMPAGEIVGWEVGFTWYALPVEWRPLTRLDMGMDPGPAVRIVHADPARLAAYRCMDLVNTRGRAPIPGRDLERALQLLFGLE